MKAPNPGLIKPFNLDPAEYDAMYNGPLPEKLTAVLFLSGNISTEELWEKLESCLDDNDSDKKYPGFSSPAFLSPASVGLSIEIALVTARTSNWREYSRGWHFVLPFTDDSWDIQLAFLDGSRNHRFQPLDALAVSMDIHDHLCQAAGSLESADHGLVSTLLAHAEDFQLIVGDIYRRHWGFMNRKLIEYRNKVLVSAGALVRDLDPVAEYERFIQAGGKYFLDYPVLCP
ncbi:hypothetical protein EHM69_10535 [candidate division KSB1 bacterium]|nr:MAG: hypothetical protein EHM69_10535 [candidate division KSB1 bacterium]